MNSSILRSIESMSPPQFNHWLVQELTSKFSLSDSLQEPVTWLLRQAGKGLRPRLAFAVARACANTLTPGIVAVAVAGELLHSASLLHDDFVDGSALRRGAATLHTEFDPLTAVLAGDYLLGAAYAWLSADACETSLRRLGPAVLALAEAELSEIHHRYSNPDLAFSEKVALGKTGALFAWIASSASAEADRTDWLEAWQSWGEALGLVFQLTDDLGDCYGQFTDKPVHLDEATGTPSLLRALQALPKENAVPDYLNKKLDIVVNPPANSADLDEITRRIADMATAALPLQPDIRATG